MQIFSACLLHLWDDKVVLPQVMTSLLGAMGIVYISDDVNCCASAVNIIRAWLMTHLQLLASCTRLCALEFSVLYIFLKHLQGSKKHAPDADTPKYRLYCSGCLSTVAIVSDENLKVIIKSKSGHGLKERRVANHRTGEGRGGHPLPLPPSPPPPPPPHCYCQGAPSLL